MKYSSVPVISQVLFKFLVVETGRSHGNLCGRYTKAWPVLPVSELNPPPTNKNFRILF
jgi:hypothetical protein